MDIAKAALDIILEFRSTIVEVKYNRLRCDHLLQLCDIIDYEVKHGVIQKSDDTLFLGLNKALTDCRQFALRLTTSGFDSVMEAKHVAGLCESHARTLEHWVRTMHANVPVVESSQFIKQDAEFILASQKIEDRRRKAQKFAKRSSLSPKDLAAAIIEPINIQIGVKLDDFTLGVVRKGLLNNKHEVHLRILAEKMEPQMIEIAKKGILLNKKLKDCALTNILHIHGICNGNIIVTESTSHGPLNSFQYEIPDLDKVSIARKIAAAVRSLHEVGVIHKDIRACNILLDDGLEPKLTGFELSREVKDGTGRQEVEDHVRYWWSPEKKDGSTKQSDVYSFGVLLYEISLRKEPNTGDAETLIKEEMGNIHHDFSVLIRECLSPKAERLSMEQVFGRLVSIES
ncbi:hypothetical protein BGZ98_000575, partial [Dissophora globulifera]